MKHENSITYKNHTKEAEIKRFNTVCMFDFSVEIAPAEIPTLSVLLTAWITSLYKYQNAVYQN